MGCALSAPQQGKVVYPSPPGPAEEVEQAEARDAIRLRATNAMLKAERAAARKHRLRLRAEAAAERAGQSALEAQRAQEALLRLDEPEFHLLHTVEVSGTETINTVPTLSLRTMDESSESEDGNEQLGPYTQTFEDNVIPRSFSIQYYAQDDDTTLSSCDPALYNLKPPTVRDVARLLEIQSTQEDGRNAVYPLSNSSKPHVSHRANRLREISLGDNADFSTSSDSDFSASTQPVSGELPENFSLQPSVSDYSHMFDFDLDSEPQERVRKLPSVRRQLPAQVQTRRRKTFCFGGPDREFRSTAGSYVDTSVRTPFRPVQSDLGRMA